MSNRLKKQHGSESGSDSRSGGTNWINMIGMVAIGVVLGAVLYATLFKRPPAPVAAPAPPPATAATSATPAQPPPQGPCPTRTGEPWEFDAPTNCHYDPAHAHWHQGPPPSDPAERARLMSGGAPQPIQIQPTLTPVEIPATGGN